MSTLSLEPALWVVTRASALIAIAALVQVIIGRRWSAATRHLVWTLTIVSVLLLPLATWALPAWSVVLPSRPSAAQDAVPLPAAPELRAESPRLAPMASPITAPSTPTRIEWASMAMTLYVGGVLLMLIRLCLQQWSVRRFATQATMVRDGRWTALLHESAQALGVRRMVRLLCSREHSVPVALGIRRPTIVIPSIAETWTDDRRRAVVLHEMAHVARLDCFTQTLASVACALYWFHPASWWVARRLRVERELACDDRVIAAGTEARDYAGHLLEIAYSVGRRQAPALAVSMASSSQLEGRMLAALDARRNRRVPAARSRLTASAAAVVLSLIVATATPTFTAPATPQPPPQPATVSAAPDDRPTLVRETAGRLRELGRDAVRTAASAAAFLQDNLPGTWEIRPASRDDGTVHLRLVELNSSSGTNVPIDRFEGLTAAQLRGAGGPVQFRLRRDAGTFTFEGVLRNGVGAGTFSFTADANFPSELAKRGFARPSAREQYQMARHDVGFALIDELGRQGYGKPQTSELVRAGQHGVDATYVREMGALGHRLGSLDPLVTLRDHGVGPSFIKELAGLGYKSLSADELRRARDHGISPEYVRGMRDAGYGSLPMDVLINARDHGVSPEYVRELADAGHRKLTLDHVIRVRDHGVSGDYAREMRALGHALGIDELVRARDHGVSVEFVREMAALGYANLPLDTLIRLRDHGVSPGYVRELKALGYDKLAMDDLVMLRDHGLSAERIKRANDRAGTRLPLDLLKSLAAGGGIR